MIGVQTQGTVLDKSIMFAKHAAGEAGGTACPTSVTLKMQDLLWWRRRFRLRG